MRRHDVDVLSLMAGLLFMLMGLGWLLDAADAFRVDWEWLAPLVLVGLGLVGLLTSFLGRGETDPPVEE